MTTIKEVIERTEIIKGLGTKTAKLAYIAKLSPDVQQFLSASININGIGPELYKSVTTGNTNVTIEELIKVLDVASKVSSSNEKRAIIESVTLSTNDRVFVGRVLYSIDGSIKLGVTIPRVSNTKTDIISPMLAKSKDFDPSRYQIEPKLDGYRLIARKVDGEVILHSRNGKPLVAEFITRELERCLPDETVIDGEILAMDGEFQSLKRHGNDIQYQVFDCLYADGQNIMNQDLTHRRAHLEGLGLDGRIGIPEILDLSTLNEVDDWIKTTGAEGVIAKDRHEPYKPKSRGWIKRKLMNDLNAKIVGMTKGQGKRKDVLGALIVEPEGLNGVQTKVGTGFTDEQLHAITAFLSDDQQLNCVVRYQDITRDGKLRFPVFVRLL